MGHHRKNSSDEEIYKACLEYQKKTLVKHLGNVSLVVLR